MIPNFDHESNLWHQGHTVVIGVDEVGRGALAGPVVAAAVTFKPFANFKHNLRDSKQLTAKSRRELLSFILDHALAWELGIASAQFIDQKGIVAATFAAMEQSIMPFSPLACLLVDGPWSPKFTQAKFNFIQPIIKGDQKSVSIAAASIIAKVFRDALMQQLGNIYPNYDWQRNKGYATLKHRNEIKLCGSTEFHRSSFITSLV